MRKVTGYIYDAAIGTDEFEFYVEDEVTVCEINDMVLNRVTISYEVEDGYKQVMVPTYVKED